MTGVQTCALPICGTSRPDSDYDVALVFPSWVRKENEIPHSALKLSEQLHAAYGKDMPSYKGNPLDLQLFFADDPELATYSRVPLQRERKELLVSPYDFAQGGLACLRR